MLRAALIGLAALLVATTAVAEPVGHCMALSELGGCTKGRVKDADGILLPGLHVYYTQPTQRYDHGILGDAIEWGALTYVRQGSAAHGPYIFEEIKLPATRVFEDIAPRLVDLDGDGAVEIITIETHLQKGAQLAIYGLVDGALTKITATPHIGRSHRWLAPIGAADLDGDGYTEIAYIDRPHLARLLKIWRFKDGKLRLVAEHGGLTNHKIGQDYISGGIRDCGAGPQLITANTDWSRIVASTFNGTKIHSVVIGKHKGQKSFKRAMECRM